MLVISATFNTPLLPTGCMGVSCRLIIESKQSKAFQHLGRGSRLLFKMDRSDERVRCFVLVLEFAHRHLTSQNVISVEIICRRAVSSS